MRNLETQWNIIWIQQYYIDSTHKAIFAQNKNLYLSRLPVQRCLSVQYHPCLLKHRAQPSIFTSNIATCVTLCDYCRLLILASNMNVSLWQLWNNMLLVAVSRVHDFKCQQDSTTKWNYESQSELLADRLRTGGGDYGTTGHQRKKHWKNLLLGPRTCQKRIVKTKKQAECWRANLYK